MRRFAIAAVFFFVRIAASAQSFAVESTDGTLIPGLFAAGELVGGLFYHNYPGGTGLTSGAVFGRIAGTSAGAYVTGP